MPDPTDPLSPPDFSAGGSDLPMLATVGAGFSRTMPGQIVNYGTTGADVRMPCAGTDELAIQVAMLQSGGWPTGLTLAVEVSSDGINFSALATPVSVTALGFKPSIPITGAAWVRLVQSAAPSTPGNYYFVVDLTAVKTTTA